MPRQLAVAEVLGNRDLVAGDEYPPVVHEVVPLPVDPAHAERHRVAELLLECHVELVQIRWLQAVVDRLRVPANADHVGQHELRAVPLEEVVARLLGHAGVDRVGDALDQELVVAAVRPGDEGLAVGEEVVDARHARREVRRVDDGVADVAVGVLLVHPEADVEEEVLPDLEFIQGVKSPDLPGRSRSLRRREVEPLIPHRENGLPRDRVEVGDDEELVVRVDERSDRLQILIVDAHLELVRAAEELLVEVDGQVRLLAGALDEAVEGGAVVHEAIRQVDVGRAVSLEGGYGDVAVLLGKERFGR